MVKNQKPRSRRNPDISESTETQHRETKYMVNKIYGKKLTKKIELPTCL